MSQNLRILVALVCALFPLVVGAQDDVYTSEEAAAAHPAFAIQGEYVGSDEEGRAKGVQVVAHGEDQFRAVVYNGGLPGAGWDRKPPQVSNDEDKVGIESLVQRFSLKKTTRQSPTLNAKPPTNAIVLFDGTQASLDKHWKPGAKMSDDGLLMQGATTTDTFQDFSAHLEFLLPYMPKARGQGRGNSGAYFQGRYETQVLDSFGLEGKNNEAGGIYEIRDPDLNMCFPPLTWQTYDVDFTAARWDENGEKISNARLTVRLNGIVVQRDVEVPRITRAAPLKESPEPGPLYLQNHGNPVRYRNIWVVPRDADREARRPILPGFERFFANAEEPAHGGAYLLGELGCVNCHKANDVLAQQINVKQAPILSQVGSRVRPEWMVNFIADPHTVKPGTTMPALFEGWEDARKEEAVLALTNFLVSTGTLAENASDKQAINRGRKLFHEVGCVACHAPMEGDVKVAASTSVPLANLPEKYTIPSLVEFLKNPHAVRPSGRMPSLNLSDKENEPVSLAQYLLAGAERTVVQNVRFKGYHGSWQTLPDFDNLEVKTEGTSAGLDTSVAGKPHQFGLRFEGYFKVDNPGKYRFWLGSDDGSRLVIDGEEIIRVDGIHPHSTQDKEIELSQGVHTVLVDYFEQAGDVSLSLEVQPPGGSRQDAAGLLTLHEDGSPVKPPATNEVREDGLLAYQHRPELVSKGKELFGSLGCANCHQLKQGEQTIASSLVSKSLTSLDVAQGCLSPEVVSGDKNIPNFDLSPVQFQALTAAISQDDHAKPMPDQTLHRTLATFNCYACHERGSLGGPEFARNPLFITTQHEMGDEGRIPPPLNGVGDKLQDNWLRKLLNEGANDRPYMLTRMPKFGGNNIGHLAEAFVELDRRDEAELANFDEPEHRVKATGRALVGADNLACIKCHTFGKHRATGIQAIDLTSMTQRIREDWFLRYLYEPAKYRPGTRMPTGFPDGKAVIQNIYKGDPNQQISAIWTFLEDGTKAGIPDGLIAKMEELKPVSEPIIYRNFIAGLSPRGIAVGYPELAHIAWDANDLCLKRIWHGRFMDASLHWTGRGQGQQVPLGDHIMDLEPNIPVAQLPSQDAPWPTQSPKRRPGYQFKGYQLDDAGRPTFMYEWPAGTVHDYPVPTKRSDKDASIQRTLTINVKQGVDDAYFRAAVGQTIEPTVGGYHVNDAITIKFSGGDPIVRKVGNQSELLVPLKPGTNELIQEIIW